jgi:hypothetical protein
MRHSNRRMQCTPRTHPSIVRELHELVGLLLVDFSAPVVSFTFLTELPAAKANHTQLEPAGTTLSNLQRHVSFLWNSVKDVKMELLPFAR